MIPSAKHKVVQHLVRKCDTVTSDYKGAMPLSRKRCGKTREMPGFSANLDFFTRLLNNPKRIIRRCSYMSFGRIQLDEGENAGGGLTGYFSDIPRLILLILMFLAAVTGGYINTVLDQPSHGLLTVPLKNHSSEVSVPVSRVLPPSEIRSLPGDGTMNGMFPAKV